MPSVPYSGAPTVAPQLDPTPRYTADVSPDMFGANIGRAISQLGATSDQVGNEVFARGIAMQDLANHSEAQKADADFMEKAGDIHAKLSSMQGKEAVDYFNNGYKDDMKKVREDVGATLSNPMSRKLYDSQSLSTYGRNIFNAAGHAASQLKVYSLGASQAKVEAIGNRTLSMPGDEDAFQDGLQDTEDEVRSQGALKGMAPEAIDEAVANQKSALWSQRIKGIVKSQPIQAGKMLEQAIKDGDIQGEDQGKLKDMVDAARRTVGSRMVSNQVFSGSGIRWGQATVDIKAAGEAIGQIESGGNYASIGIQTSHGRALGKYQVMEEYLPEFLKKAGLPAMTSAEYLKDHSAQDAVFSANFGAYMKKTGSANDAASMWLTGKPLSKAGNVKDALGTNAQTYVGKFNAALVKSATLSDKVAMGKAIAAEQAPDDPLFPDYVQQRIEADHNQQIAIKRDDQFNNRQVVEAGLMGGQDGKLPTSVEQLTADPKTAAAWEKLDPSVQRRYMGVMAQNAKGDRAWNDDTLRQYQTLKGQAQADPADFIDMDVIGTNLPMSAKKELINLQEQLKGKAEADPRVGRALNILAPDLAAAGVDKKVDKDGFYQFTGTLADQLQQFADDNKRGPKPDEVKLIGSRLLQSQTQKGWLWNSKVPTYQLPVPKEEAEKITADPAWQQLGIVPTDVQVQRIYTRNLYKNLYGAAPKAQTMAKGGGAPISE
jgi:hypothetical protein